MDNLSLAELMQANAARQKLWDPENKIDIAYRGNELAGEVGEACNLLKKIRREQLGLPGSRADLNHLAEELADVVICVALCAAAVDVDLGAAVRRKFNLTSDAVGFPIKL